MAKKNQWQSFVLLSCQPGQLPDIVENDPVPCLVRKVAPVRLVLHRSTMTEVIVAENDHPLPGQIIRKAIVAVDELDHAMRQLDDGHWLLLRLPLDRPDPGLAIAGLKVELLFRHRLAPDAVVRNGRYCHIQSGEDQSLTNSWMRSAGVSAGTGEPAKSLMFRVTMRSHLSR